MDCIHVLDFDSEIFGFKVAKIVPDRLDKPNLQAALERLKDQQVRLAYWASDSSDLVSQQAASDYQGLLVDKKATYIIDFDQLAKSPMKLWQVQEYPQGDPDTALIKLAIESGAYSRFKTDSHIPPEIFLEIYTRWISNSTQRRIATHVFYIKHQGTTVGMVTLGEKHGRGDIGLLAVALEARGKQLGLHLVCAAQAKFIEAGYRIGQVVTQLDNVAACKLYEKCGYHLEKLENFYHFWL